MQAIIIKIVIFKDGNQWLSNTLVLRPPIIIALQKVRNMDMQTSSSDGYKNSTMPFIKNNLIKEFTTILSV